MLKRTYRFEFNENSDLEVLAGIFSDLKIYPSHTNSLLSFRYVDDRRIEKITLIFPQRLKYFNEDKFTYHLTNGRFFTENEIEDGSDNIILDYKDFKIYYSVNTIGDSILYEGSNYKLIGINNAINNSHTILPYNTIRKNTEFQSKDNIYIDSTEIVFPQKLSRYILNELHKEFQEKTGNPIDVQTVYSQVISSIIPYLMIYILFMGLILLLFILCIKQLFLIMDFVNKYKYDALLRLGMDRTMWKIIRLISMETYLLVSYIISIILFYLMVPMISQKGFQISLTVWNTFIIFLLFQFIMLSTTNYNKISRKRAEWRN